MNVNPDPENDSRLLDAILRDESWHEDAAAGRAHALRVFHARQRTRGVARRSACIGGLIVLSAAVWWFGPALRPHQSPLALQSEPAPPKPLPPAPMSDAELLAVFPPGSCVLAEIDGRKELVFLDPALEAVYLAKP